MGLGVHTNRGNGVALVLAGGGARGAYEAGALSILLPELERRGERPRVLVGTSIGALNVSVLAGLAHRPATEVAEALLRHWLDLRTSDGLAPLYSLAQLRRLVLLAGQAVGLPAPRSLVDLSPYEETIANVVDFEAGRSNIEGGRLSSLAVATTSYSEGECVVFHDSAAGVLEPPFDPDRQIRYVRTPLRVEHVRASGSVQALSSATEVTHPAELRGWYGDGAARLNTPIKPALELGADRVLVVGLDPIAPPAHPDTSQPNVFNGLNQALRGLLADQLAHDVANLASRNMSGGHDRVVPYAFVAPRNRDVLGEIARDVYAENLLGPINALRNPDLATLGRLLGVERSAARGSLYSLLFIHPAYAEALIERGQRDAERWLAEHDDFWQVGPLALPDQASLAPDSSLVE